MEEPLLLLRVGWLAQYSGPEATLSGAGSGLDIGHDWECCNFAPHRGRVYGYCSGSRHRTINISRLGAPGDVIDGILVVWVSPHPREGRQRVIGWYQHAKVYRDLQPGPAGRTCRDNEGRRIEFNVSALSGDATLLPPEERTFEVPRAAGFMGQANVGYLKSEAARTLVTSLRRYISNYVSGQTLFRIPNEVIGGPYSEGSTTRITVNAYERDPCARAECIRHYGTACVVCGMSMSDIYGLAAEGLIHVHHIVPLANAGRSTNVDPVRDLRPVCPNCHAIIHRRDPPYTIEDVQQMLIPRRAG